jgi:hypothetical protein
MLSQDTAICRAADLAKRAKTIGATSSSIDKLADVGRGGKQNAQRNFFRKLPQVHSLIHSFKIPMKLGGVQRRRRDRGTGWLDWPFILPHDILIELVKVDRFTEACGANISHGEFWRAWMEDELLCPTHRIRHTTDLDVLPLYIHSDEVEARTGSGGNEAHRVWSWSCATTRGNSADTKFVITHYPTWFAAPETNSVVIGILGWIFDALWAGKVPDFDPDGNRLVNATCPFQRSALAGYKSDAAEKVKIHNYSRFYSCINVCERCWASTTPGAFFYGNLHPAAPYSRYPITAAQFKAMEVTLSEFSMPFRRTGAPGNTGTTCSTSFTTPGSSLTLWG